MAGRIIYGNVPDVKDTNYYFSVREIIIDMSGWGTNDTSLAEKGTYPYVVKYHNHTERTEYTAACTEMRSGGLQELLNFLETEHHAIVHDSSQVKIICPKELVKLDKRFSCTCSFPLSALREKGLDEVMTFDVSYENNVGKRLESVLDECLHRANVNSFDMPLYRSKECVLPESIYHYAKADFLNAQCVQKAPHKDRRNFDGPSYQLY